MKRGSEWLSRGAELLADDEDANPHQPPSFDVLVVGSGYGGAVAAARIAEWSKKQGKSLRIGMLERGLEYLPGDFPRTLDELTAHVRFSGGAQPGVRGWRDGLFDMRIGDDVSALIANGLGGGSLINAGVAERADAATLADPAWPVPWRGDEALWDRLYGCAEKQLAASRWVPTGVPKEAAMHKLAAQLGAGDKAQPVMLTIQPPGQNQAGALPLSGCLQCGDCFSGCNVGAKRTLGTTYLKQAHDGGVEIFTGATVLHLAHGPDKAWPWLVRWVFSDPKRLPAREKPYTLRAQRVVLAAGTFGSTEILLRSQRTGLRFSSQLGAGFSSNGDVIGAQYGLKDVVRPWAREDVSRDERRVGPTITHMVELDRGDRSAPARRLVVQDITVPAPLGWLFTELLTSLMLPQRWTRFDWRPRKAESFDPAVVDDAEKGGLARTLLLSAFSHDGAAGRLHALPGFDKALYDGNLVVHWPGAGQADCFWQADRRLLAATGQTAAFWLRNPLWQAVPDSPLIESTERRQLVTVHPLGGCRMAHTMEDGVVDAHGRVFDAGEMDAAPGLGQQGAEWAAREDQRLHPGLYVLDGSIVPTSLGINPLLTITALAEGIVAQWLLDWQAVAAKVSSLAAQRVLPPWPVNAPVPQAAPVAKTSSQTATRLTFAERMVGLLEPALQSSASDDEQLFLRVKFGFEPIDDVQHFVRQQPKTRRFTGELSLVCTSWDDASARQKDREGTAPNQQPVSVCGDVGWFVQQPICVLPRMWRTFRGWWRMRKAADLFEIDRDGSRVPSLWLRPQDWPAFLHKVYEFIKMLTHFGAPRLLSYRFEPLARELTATTRDGQTVTLPKGTVLRGEKSLVYEAGGNPWVQLTEMALYCDPPVSGLRGPLVTLRYDQMFMLGRDELPLMLERQHDGVTGLRDLLSLGFYIGRVVFLQHFLAFRKPDYALHRPVGRLPSPHATATLVWTVFDDVWVNQPAAGGGDIRLRLTRLHKKAAAPGQRGDPVLLLHGFGSGGIQYTHEAIPTPMATWLAEQGRDVWVGELRTSIGLPTCEQQWVMDHIATEDIPALIEAVQRKRAQLEGRPPGEPIDIVAHCIGSAMFCMAALAGKIQGRVRRAVLMQVGPIVHLPRGNRMRGYLGNRAQKLFRFRLVKASVNDDASEAEEALDRVLATFPYLGGDDPTRWRTRARATDQGLALSSDLRHNGRLVNVRRCAGVFAQLFQWPNMDNQQLLDALPDLLGPCNLTTYQQTVQYAFLRQLTNQAGEDAYVTDDNIRDNLAFPILFVQGMLNDVFAPRGTHESMRLIQRVHGTNHPVGRLEVPGYGHLDCVVGKDTKTLVFEPMLAFLDHLKFPAPSAGAVAANPPGVVFRAPSIGPWIGHAQWMPDNSLHLQLGLKVDDLRTPPAYICTVLAPGGRPDATTLVMHTTTIANGAPPIGGASTAKAPFFWREGEAVLHVEAGAPVAAGAVGFEVWVCVPEGDPIPPASQFVAVWAKKRAQWSRVDSVEVSPEWLAASRPGVSDISFALMSCRQAPLLVDRRIADRAFKGFLNKVKDAPLHPHHVLMVGDQIYADALAASGGVDGTRLRFFDAYREAWTAEYQRELMRHWPVYMAADDHEFRDDHTDVTRSQHPREWKSAQAAMWRYQYAAGPRGAAPGPRRSSLWYEMTHAGFHTFVCDTRNERREDQTIAGDHASIMADDQFAAIEAWLQRSKASGRPRFLVLPTPLAPVFRHAVVEPGYRVRCDDWQRYPCSLAKLFGLLVADGADRLVLLSGDYHCFVDCDVSVTDPASKATVTFRSITTSGMHCPYGFANTDRHELWESEPAQPELHCRPYPWRYTIRKFDSGPGYVRIRTRGVNPVQADFMASP